MNGGRQRLSDVANAATDEPFGGLGVSFAEGLYAAADLGEEVASFEFEIVVVEEGHEGET
mgnify:CR=1 FL=1